MIPIIITRNPGTPENTRNSHSKITEPIIKAIKTYLKQLYIDAEVHVTAPINLSDSFLRVGVKDKKGNVIKTQENSPKIPVFDYFFCPGGKVNTAKKTDDYQEKYKDMSIFEFLNVCFHKEYPELEKKPDFYKLYFIDRIPFSDGGTEKTGTADAFATPPTNAGIIFPEGFTETTPVHEIGHLLGLPHTFAETNPRCAAFYKKTRATTENIMDYSKQSERKSFTHYQMKAVWKQNKMK